MNIVDKNNGVRYLCQLKNYKNFQQIDKNII